MPEGGQATALANRLHREFILACYQRALFRLSVPLNSVVIMADDQSLRLV